MKKLFIGRKKFITIPLTILIGLFFLPITLLVLVAWLIYKKVSNKKAKVVGLGIVGIFILFFGSAYVSAIINPTSSKKVESTSQPVVAGTQTEVPIAQSPSPDTNLVKVSRVIDGDTVEIEGGKHIRLIGIDTPETLRPNTPVQCFGKEASKKTKDLLEDQEIRLEKDISEVDKYNRLLRYVWKGDILINEQLVKEGYAQVSTYPPDVKYQDRFVSAQKDARDNNRGLWSACQHGSPSSQTISTQAPKAIVKPITTTTYTTPKPTTSSSVSGDSTYACNCSKTCTQMTSCAEAQYQLNTCGCSARDADDDGIACDSQCQ